MAQLTTKNFDYSVVDKDTKSKLIYYASQIQKQGAIHVESGIEIGRMLSEARELCGESFRDWVERECQYSVRSAYRYISAWENFGSCDNLAHIELSAMYELTKNKSAKKAALDMAKRGKKVTHEIAKKLIAKHSESSSDKGKPGGGASSSAKAPVADGPASDATATDSEDPFDVEEDDSARESRPENGASDRRHTVNSPAAESDSEDPPAKPKNGKAGKPHDPDEVFKTERSKTVKTVEALIRCFDDLHELKHNPKHDSVVATCKSLLAVAKGW